MISSSTGKKITAITVDGKTVTKIEGNKYISDDFLECNYIENIASAYIDTGYIANVNTYTEEKFSVDDFSNLYVCFAANDSGNSAQYRAFCSNSAFYFASGANRVENTVTTATNTEYIVSLDSSSAYINGTKYNTASSSSGYSSSAKLLIGKDNFSSAYTSHGKIYYVKVKENGTLIRDYVPCYKVSTCEYGLFDKVNSKFYSSSSSSSYSGKIKTVTIWAKSS